MAEHEVTINRVTNETVLLTVTGGSRHENVRNENTEIESIRCSCKECFGSIPEATKHLRKNDDNVDVGAVADVIESLLADDWYCDLDQSLLIGANDGLHYQIRLFIDEAEDGMPTDGHVWFRVDQTADGTHGDLCAATEIVAWRDAVGYVLELAEAIDEGVTQVAPLFRILDDWNRNVQDLEIGEYDY